MAEQHGPWSPAAARSPGRLPPPVPAQPSGLFPGAAPPRPHYREPYAIGTGPVLAGLGAGLLWVVLFGAVGRDLVGYAWWTLFAAVSAWAVAVVLAWVGDPGVAVGVAASTVLGWSIATGFVAARWITTGDWPMW